MGDQGTSNTDRIQAAGLDIGDISGKALLEIGSASGELCLAALELGAARVVGIDPSGERMSSARRAIGGRPVELVESDFETWEDRGATFDIVICSNVLHHMLDPIHALRRLMRLAREKLVIEFSVPTLRDVRKYCASPAAMLGGGAGLIAPAYARYNTDIYGRTYFFTPGAIRTILNRHSVMFEPVTINRSRRAGRFLAVANRRRIEHLTVIAGPTSSGKSTLYRQLDSSLRTELGIPQQDSAYVTASEVLALPKGPHEHAVLHYDMLRPFASSLHGYARDIASELITIAKRVTFVTIFAEPSRLRRQLTKGEIDSRRPSKQSARHLRLLQLYADPQFLPSWYSRWLSYCGRFDGKSAGHFIVENRGTFDVRPASKENFPFFVSLARPDDAVERG